MPILPVIHNLIYKENSLPVRENPLSVFSKYVSMPSYDVFEKSDNGIMLSDKTFQKAKDIVILSILEENPTESMVFVMNDKLVYQAKGESTYVKPSKYALNLLDNPQNSIAIIHSHPNLSNVGNYAPSLSFNDFNILVLSKGAKSIYAINSDGEYAMLEKSGKNKISQAKISRFEKFYDNELKKKNAQISKLKEEVSHGMDRIDERISNGGKIENIDEIMQEMSRKMDYVNRVSISREHNFWINYASLFNLKYDTDFSYFI